MGVVRCFFSKGGNQKIVESETISFGFNCFSASALWADVEKLIIVSLYLMKPHKVKPLK